jgi:hypothetical protein
MLNWAADLEGYAQYEEFVSELADLQGNNYSAVEKNEGSILTQPYMACLSEHHTKEDELGRLSMWRAYGHPNGVCIVFNTPTVINEIGNHGALLMPVTYGNEKTLDKFFRDSCIWICAVKDKLDTIPKKIIQRAFMDSLLFQVISLKHPGFSEENEWRLIYLDRNKDLPIHFSKDTVCANGIPQKIFRAKFEHILGNQKNIPKKATLAVDRIIIGPCETPRIIGDAFIDLLQEKGYPDAAKRVVISEIPLR